MATANTTRNYSPAQRELMMTELRRIQNRIRRDMKNNGTLEGLLTFVGTRLQEYQPKAKATTRSTRSRSARQPIHVDNI